MPELPEVETVARTLAPRVEKRVILDARFASRRVMRDDPEEAARRLRGHTILALGRRAKFLIFELDRGLTLSVHLGMTGKLLWNGPEGPYTRAVFALDGGRLVYDDVRQFGRIEVSAALPGRIGRLGPEPLSISETEFTARLGLRRGRIKPLLLNQAFLGGIGNIYADESLFRARIHPRARAERLGRLRAGRLYDAIRAVLTAAIERGGSSVSDYVDANGDPGSFQFEHNVYGRAGEPCTECGAPIRRIVLGQRGTHYCPRCQKT